MDDFLLWLGTGIVMMIVLFIFFGGAPLTFPPQQQYPRYPYSPEISPTTFPEKSESGAIFVGTITEEVWRNIEFINISTVYKAVDILKSLSDKRLYNGLLFGSNKLEINFDVDPDNTISTYLSFFVYDTNKYGNLVIKINDYVIHDKVLTTGNYIFNLNKTLLKDKNKVEISTRSSGWKIWAPSVYILKNIKITSQEVYARKSEYKFNISDEEYNSLSKRQGRISLDLKEHSGKLSIIINDKEVFSGEMEKAVKDIYFDQNVLKRWENKVEFIAEDGNFEGYGKLTFYYNKINYKKAEKEFVLSSYDYDNLHRSPGKITFEIERVINPGGFAVLIENENKKIYQVAYGIVEEKKYEYSLYPHLCFAGYNKVIVKSVDNSSFYVKNLNIILR
jgi:hypothetical protein